MSVRAHADLESAVSMEQMQVARVYADAVWQAAVADGSLDAFHAEFDATVTQVLKGQPELATFLVLETVGAEEKRQVVEAAYGPERTSPLLHQFLVTLLRHGRIDLLPAVAVALERRWNGHRGKVAVTVVSAVALTGEERDRLTGILKDGMGVDPELAEEVGPELLGGLTVRIGDRVYDRSLARNLQHMHDQILRRSSDAIQGG